MDYITMLNFIRENAPNDYQDRVPVVTTDNIADGLRAITSYQGHMNDALNVLVDRIALSIIANKAYSNPLSLFKKGGIPLGGGVQDIFTNLAEDKGFDPTGSGVLTATDPDVKALYYTLNRQSQYETTVRKQQLAQAFLTSEALTSLLNSIVNSLYSGDSVDEFLLMKNLFGDSVFEGRIKSLTVDDLFVADSAVASGNASKLVKAIKTVSGLFKFPSANYNTYADFVTDTGKPCITYCPRENQVLLVRSDVLTSISVDVLAQAFNLDKVDFSGRIIEVDNFGMAINTLAILVDESAVQVYDSLFETSNIYNPKGLFWKYYLNRWQIYGFRLFANAQAFTLPSVTLDVTTITKDSKIIVVSDSTGLEVGMSVAGIGVAGGATITNINVDGVTITISADALITRDDGKLMFV